MNYCANFEKIDCDTWKKSYKNSNDTLNNSDLSLIRSLGGNIDFKEVDDIYLPLTQFIRIYKNNQKKMSFLRGLFLHRIVKESPFVIGVTGDIAAGKTTVSKLLKILLSNSVSQDEIKIVSISNLFFTDFYSKSTAKNEYFYDKKDIMRVVDFFCQMKDLEIFKDYEFIILEGPDIFNYFSEQLFFLKSFCDFLIYLDASEEIIDKWRREELSLNNKSWIKSDYNGTKECSKISYYQADVVLHMTLNHSVDKIFVKKF